MAVNATSYKASHKLEPKKSCLGSKVTRSLPGKAWMAWLSPQFGQLKRLNPIPPPASNAHAARAHVAADVRARRLSRREDVFIAAQGAVLGR